MTPCCWFAGVHHNQLWGDINLINGQPWPYLNVTASWQRFRILNASPSRPRILMVQPPFTIHLSPFTLCHAASLHWVLLGFADNVLHVRTTNLSCSQPW